MALAGNELSTPSKQEFPVATLDLAQNPVGRAIRIQRNISIQDAILPSIASIEHVDLF